MPRTYSCDTLPALLSCELKALNTAMFFSLIFSVCNRKLIKIYSFTCYGLVGYFHYTFQSDFFLGVLQIEVILVS